MGHLKSLYQLSPGLFFSTLFALSLAVFLASNPVLGPCWHIDKETLHKTCGGEPPIRSPALIESVEERLSVCSLRMNLMPLYSIRSSHGGSKVFKSLNTTICSDGPSMCRPHTAAGVNMPRLVQAHAVASMRCPVDELHSVHLPDLFRKSNVSNGCIMLRLGLFARDPSSWQVFQ